MKLENLPSRCVCGASFDMTHALTCKTGGFVTRRHNELRDLFAKTISDMCVDVRSEPQLTPLETEVLPRGANATNDARLDISAMSFWRRGQRAFFMSEYLTHSPSPTSLSL